MTSSSTSPSPSSTKITDLDEDSLVQVANYLSLRELSNMSMSCKLLKSVAYSDSIWLRLFREQWPHQNLRAFSQASGVRETFLARRTAIQQYKFVDPLIVDYYMDSRPFSHLLLHKNDIIFSQESIDEFLCCKGRWIAHILFMST
ncbi:hypothetical protein Ancab_005642 [Ancistrocladus abbreviatus]